MPLDQLGALERTLHRPRGVRVQPRRVRHRTHGLGRHTTTADDRSSPLRLLLRLLLRVFDAAASVGVIALALERAHEIRAVGRLAALGQPRWLRRRVEPRLLLRGETRHGASAEEPGSERSRRARRLERPLRRRLRARPARFRRGRRAHDALVGPLATGAHRSRALHGELPHLIAGLHRAKRHGIRIHRGGKREGPASRRAKLTQPTEEIVRRVLVSHGTVANDGVREVGRGGDPAGERGDESLSVFDAGRRATSKTVEKTARAGADSDSADAGARAAEPARASTAAHGEPPPGGPRGFALGARAGDGDGIVPSAGPAGSAGVALKPGGGGGGAGGGGGVPDVAAIASSAIAVPSSAACGVEVSWGRAPSAAARGAAGTLALVLSPTRRRSLLVPTAALLLLIAPAAAGVVARERGVHGDLRGGGRGRMGRGSQRE